MPRNWLTAAVAETTGRWFNQLGCESPLLMVIILEPE